MTKFTAHRLSPDAANISQLSIKRDWMDETFDRHAYHCFPVTLTNGLGWGISFPEDITFIWDGVFDSTPDHVKILAGEKYAYTGRGQATVSFKTGLLFETDEDTSLLTMPVPNQFVDGATCFSTLLSTSFFKGDVPIAWMVTRPNVEITIPAGTPIASLIPLSLGRLQEFELTVTDQPLPADFFQSMQGYGEKIQEIIATGNWAHFYRNATDANGNSIGNHEVKALRLKTENNYGSKNQDSI
jgi:hypothetical protein